MARQDSWKHLYSTAAWQQLRRSQLTAEPICRYCNQLGKVIAATVADHVKAHKGDTELFFDPDNLQSLCKTCHDGAKQQLERTGRLRGCDENGHPLDPNSHWYR